MNHISWNIDPVMLHIGPLALRWYGLLFASGLLLGLFIMQYIFKRENKDTSLLDPLFLYMVIGVVVGARLAHCLIYEPDYYLAHPMEIFYVWKGGLASHGGIIGFILALWLFCRRYKVSYIWLFARLGVPLFLLAGLIRIGNFFNSEIIGKASNLPWSIVFERIDSTPRHPVMLYEALGYFAIFIFGFLLYLRWPAKKFTYLYPGIAIILGFSVRFMLEWFKIPQADYSTGIALNVGQLLSLPFIAIGIILFIWGKHQLKDNS